MEEMIPKKVDAFLSFEKAVVGVDGQKVGYVLLQALEKVAMGSAMLMFELESQKVDKVLLTFGMVGAAVLQFV